MKLMPLHDWAVIVPSEAEARTAGGLFIPETAKEKPQEGVIEAIGPGAYEEEKRGKKKEDGKERKFIPSVVKPGDRVLYERWAGQTVAIGTAERILVRERNILGIIDRPLIPAATSSAAQTALAERQVGALSMSPRPVADTPVQSVNKKAAKKPLAAKKTAKKASKKKAAEKAAVKKSASKAAQKPAKGKKAGKKKQKKS